VAVQRKPPRVLSIAASDSGGGAGIQADLKAFARCGVYGMTAITAVTAQNTRGVSAVHAVPARIVRAQIDAVVADIGVDAVKIGMLGTTAVARAVATWLRVSLDPSTPLVIDPVMRASTGASLLDPGALDVLAGELLPRATVLTPNVAEAHALLAHAGLAAPRDERELANLVRSLGPTCVVLTAGHLDEPGDIYCDGTQTLALPGVHHDVRATHGSGCTHAAVLAAMLACGATPLVAAQAAASYTAAAVRNGLEAIGGGEGPVDITFASE
jgi:hydroxymethylpyrimidine/phosphomethylpyrimidine kinase